MRPEDPLRGTSPHERRARMCVVGCCARSLAREGSMKRCILAMVFAIAVAGVTLQVGVAQDSTAAQIARVEGPQSPNRQGYDPYTLPEIMKRFHVPGVSIAVVHDFQVQWTKT